MKYYSYFTYIYIYVIVYLGFIVLKVVGFIRKKSSMKKERVIRMNKKKSITKMASIMVISGIMFSCIPAFATELSEPITPVELPESITMDGKVFIMDKSAGSGSGTATPENKSMNITRSSYKVTGSDVRLYVDSSHGHGGDHFPLAG
ncbi:hypothetical protein [Lysinibacillus fusiformis]|uniref:hypothetical protein n=1 Tax=Lysinibacillus fusiformis TaxID=28031 RepID=UPI001F05B290|nr:hypothetical protein [Lysinibacillus fusiformis]